MGLTYNEIKDRVESINQRDYDYASPFFEQVDRILDESEGKHVETVLMEGFEKLLGQVDREIGIIEQEPDLKPSCALGCAHCCYFPIMITRLEAKFMLRYIQRLEDDRKAQVIEHIHTYLKTYESELEAVRSIDFKNDPSFKLRYKELNVPCIFLNEKTNTCMAYEVRPIPCRTYMNYANPVVCADSHMPKEPLSFEFLHSFYVEGMDEVIQEILEVVTDKDLGISYPTDAADVQYLPLLIQELLQEAE